MYNIKAVNKMSSIVDDFLSINLTMDDQLLISLMRIHSSSFRIWAVT